jgi:hypothetical protein
MCTHAIRSGALVIAVEMLLGSAGPVWAMEEDFRIDSRVFVGSDKEPRSENSTVFCRGVVYDYLEKPAEIIVFDPPRGRFILLDPARRFKVEVTTKEVLTLNENLRQWAGTQTDPFLRFLGSPKFDQRTDERTGELVLESPWVSYRVAARDAESETIAEQYRQFSDWCARLNTRLNPGYKLALARLELNEALYKRRQVPQTITLTVQSKRGFPFQKTVVRSEHQLVRHLVESDRDRVAQTDQFLAIFSPVAFDDYQKRLEP